MLKILLTIFLIQLYIDNLIFLGDTKLKKIIFKYFIVIILFTLTSSFIVSAQNFNYKIPREELDKLTPEERSKVEMFLRQQKEKELYRKPAVPGKREIYEVPYEERKGYEGERGRYEEEIKIQKERSLEDELEEIPLIYRIQVEKMLKKPEVDPQKEAEQLKKFPPAIRTKVEDILRRQRKIKAYERPVGEVTPEKIKGPRSKIERLYAEKIPAEVTKDLRQFGYDFFNEEISTFAPVTNVPAGPDYVIGPDDEFTINIWGRFDASYPVRVDRNGEITIPKIGSLKVWGMTLEKMEKYLRREFSKYYTDFKMNIVMDRLKAIKVFVVGEVKNPGSYTLSSLSTALNALYSAGGPTKDGSLRDIRINRNSESFKFDLYDFLLNGSKTQDIQLQSGDVVFVPIIKKTAAVAGFVKRPAIYEFEDKITLYELFQYCGGISPYGMTKRVQVERVIAHKQRIVLDVNISKKEDLLEKPEINISVQDGDLVKVYPIYSKIENIVYLEGNVKRPGGYELKEGMRIKDIVTSYDDLLPETYLKYARIVRLKMPDYQEEQLSFNIKKLFEGSEEENLLLRPLDRITIFSKDEMKEKENVTINGEVRYPGEYEYIDKMRVADLVYLAGNILRSAYKLNAEVVRREIKDDVITQRSIYIDLAKALAGDEKNNIFLKPDDTVFIRIIPEWENAGMKITLKGEVKFPGDYIFKKGEKLSSVLRRAGGYTDKAYLKGAIFTRKSVEKQIRSRLDEIITNLEKDILQSSIIAEYATMSPEEARAKEESLKYKKELVKKFKAATVIGRMVVKLAPLDKFENSPYDFELEDGDTLEIPKYPSTVSLLGEVYTPQSILYQKGKTVSYYLAQVGGPTNKANKSEIYLVRADGTTISRLQGRSWNPDSFGWFTPSFMNIKVEPGDTIVVPTKLEKVDFLKMADSISRTVANVAATVGIVFGAILR